MENRVVERPAKVTVMVHLEDWKELRRQAIAENKSGSEILREIVDAHLKKTRRTSRKAEAS